MAQPAETFDAYDAVGNREDLSDVIHNISPTLTPFQNNIGRGKATNIKHEWQVESLDDVDEDNAHIDGDDASGDAITPTTRVDNYCQIMRKVVIVSGRQNAANSAGRRNELAHQVAKKGKELKRDKEAILLKTKPKLSVLTYWQLAWLVLKRSFPATLTVVLVVQTVLTTVLLLPLMERNALSLKHC